MAASPSVQSKSIPRVCIIFPVTSEDRDCRYDIFIVDLNCDASDRSDLTPTFRVFCEFFDSVAFFVLEQTLYAVEGSWNCSDNRKWCKKTIFKCNLPSGSGSGVKLERSMLSKAADMNYMKTWPSAITTPDGKRAVVFSSKVRYDQFDPRDRCDFELFDPAGGCRKLPQLQPFGASSFWIDSFCFIEKSVLLVVESKRGTFTLDLDPPPAEERRWKPYMIFPYQLQDAMNRFQLIGDSICLTPFSAYDFGGGDCDWYGYGYPEDAPGVYDITALDAVSSPRDCTFCILRFWTEEYSDMEGEGDRVHVRPLVLDVYSCDVVGCKSELGKGERRSDELPCTRRVKSFQFWLEPRFCDRYYHHHYFSSIP